MLEDESFSEQFFYSLCRFRANVTKCYRIDIKLLRCLMREVLHSVECVTVMQMTKHPL